MLPALAAFGLPATVTVPGEDPVTTTVIWLPPEPSPVEGVYLRTQEAQRVLALPAAVFPVDAATRRPTIPRGTVIAAAEQVGGTVVSWGVESIKSQHADEIRLVVIPRSGG
jgi:hypothetical protein